MIPIIWPQQVITPVDGSTDGLTPQAIRVYDWVRGEYTHTGKPVSVRDVAFLFGYKHKILNSKLVPQTELAQLVDASLIYVEGDHP